MSNQNQPRHHHYNPQTALKCFSPDGYNVYRYDKENSLTQFLPISKVAAVKNYYTFEWENGEKDTSIENPFFSDIEGEYPKLIDKLEKREPLEGERDYLVSLLSAAYSRVPKQRDNIKRLVSEFKNTPLKRKYKNKGKEVEPSSRETLLSMLVVMDVYHRVTWNNSFFWVGIAQDDSLFITSDNPAAASYLPLTSKFCLFSQMKEQQYEYLPVPEKIVNEINNMTFNNAQKYIFSCEENLDIESLSQPLIKPPLAPYRLSKKSLNKTSSFRQIVV